MMPAIDAVMANTRFQDVRLDSMGRRGSGIMRVSASSFMMNCGRVYLKISTVAAADSMAGRMMVRATGVLLQSMTVDAAFLTGDGGAGAEGGALPTDAKGVGIGSWEAAATVAVGLVKAGESCTTVVLATV